jgi:hypothetical protein
MLAEYHELRPLAERFKLVEEELKAAVDAGVPVEPGPLLPRLKIYYSRRLVVDFIFNRLGLTPQQIRKLRAEAPEARYRSLSVVANPSPPPAPPGAPATAFSPMEPPRDFDPVTYE